MRQKDIHGDYIGDAIGYCHYSKHEGALNYKLAKEHKCIAKRCRHLEKYSEDAWRLKKRYRNKGGKI